MYVGIQRSRPMDWLGLTMENNLLKPQEAKVKSIKEYPVPTTAKQVISLVATASFYPRFIKSFAKIAQPMSRAEKTRFLYKKSHDVGLKFFHSI